MPSKKLPNGKCILITETRIMGKIRGKSREEKVK